MMDAFIAHGAANFLGDRYTHVTEQSLMTAARYQLIFSLFLFCLSVFWRIMPSGWIVVAQSLMLVGVVFFSGAIYAKHLLMMSSIGALAPVGGILLMLSMLALFFI